MSATTAKDVAPTQDAEAGLAPEVKQAIRTALSRIATMPGFRPRKSQRLMIAEVAKTLAGEFGGERVICVEGPTGTGKSLGYLLPSIPVAAAREKTLVIATATVALQEQLVGKDLPALRADAGLDFTFALAKGRGRYVCDRNLERLAGVNENQSDFDFGDGEHEIAAWRIRPEEGDTKTVQAMWTAREADQWSGDLDEWDGEIRGEVRGEIVTDQSGCTAKSCPWRSRCAFFNARAERWKADVIVANHALVMADLMLGGGVVLPPPDQCIYIFDEAHHLPSVAVEQGAARTRLIAPQTWLGDLEKLPGKAARALAGQKEIAKSVDDISPALTPEISALRERLNDLHRALQSVHPALAKTNTRGAPGRGRRRRGNQPDNDEVWRFEHGHVPDKLRELFAEAAMAARAVIGLTMKLGERIKAGAEEDQRNQHIATAQASAQWIAGRVDAMEIAFVQLAAEPPADPRAPPIARWIECQAQGTDFACCASPTSGAALLRGTLWSKCDGAVATSATLTALGRFDRFFGQAGLGPRFGTQAIQLTSPFDFANNAELVIPAVAADPKDHDAHTAEIIARANAGLIDPNEGTLVLFASYRQMHAVAEGLDKALAEKVLAQDSAPRHELLERHRRRIAVGDGSILFGVASFSEGVDLPGKLCTHVIIAKLPFAVPNSPVEATRAEWLEARGRNPFIEMSVPDASFKLIQAAGRLLRTETDTGRVTVLDRRLADKPYGRQMMNALPPFRRRIESLVKVVSK